MYIYINKYNTVNFKKDEERMKEKYTILRENLSIV